MQFKQYLSSQMSALILSYYKELYTNYNRATIPDIAKALEINPTTVRKFVDGYYWRDGNINLYKLIMVCTIFPSTNHHYEEQQLKFKDLIDEREKIRKKLEVYNKFKPLMKDSGQKVKKL